MKKDEERSCCVIRFSDYGRTLENDLTFNPVRFFLNVFTMTLCVFYSREWQFAKITVIPGAHFSN
jgi:hypothetical protein